jgi:hypothetical protein
MFRRLKVRKAPRPAPPTRTTWLPRKKLVFEMLEDRIVFDSASIIAENALPGTPQSVWDLNGTASDNIEGFAAQFSIDHGQTEQFKVNTDASAWHIDIYRMGYYGGDGARLITTITSHQAQNQPDPITDLNTGLVDAGNWSVSASWNIPATAVSGVYVGKLVRDDGTFGESQIIFVEVGSLQRLGRQQPVRHRPGPERPFVRSQLQPPVHHARPHRSELLLRGRTGADGVHGAERLRRHLYRVSRSGSRSGHSARPQGLHVRGA